MAGLPVTIGNAIELGERRTIFAVGAIVLLVRLIVAGEILIIVLSVFTSTYIVVPDYSDLIEPGVDDCVVYQLAIIARSIRIKLTVGISRSVCRVIEHARHIGNV